MRARCPASAANLGPGFDVLGLALNLYVEVEIAPAEQFVLHATGEGSKLPTDERHLAARVAREVLGNRPLAISVRSEIPVGRGLGSSAALAAAAAAAAGSDDPLTLAARFDGHAENAAASVLGGLVAATMIDGSPVARSLPLDDAICFVVVVPERELLTARARAVLPSEVSFADATWNLGRMGLLLAGLARHEELVPEAGDDRLHQDARTELFPEAPALLVALKDAGAHVTCWSGAGPSLLAICDSSASADAVREAGAHALATCAVGGVARRVEADRVGLVLVDD